MSWSSDINSSTELQKTGSARHLSTWNAMVMEILWLLLEPITIGPLEASLRFLGSRIRPIWMMPAILKAENRFCSLCTWNRNYPALTQAMLFMAEAGMDLPLVLGMTSTLRIIAITIRVAISTSRIATMLRIGGLWMERIRIGSFVEHREETTRVEWQNGKCMR